MRIIEINKMIVMKKGRVRVIDEKVQLEKKEMLSKKEIVEMREMKEEDKKEIEE